MSRWARARATNSAKFEHNSDKIDGKTAFSCITCPKEQVAASTGQITDVFSYRYDDRKQGQDGYFGKTIAQYRYVKDCAE